jgi:hypothetical protein
VDASRKRTHGVSNGTDACRRQIDRGPYAMRAVATYAETRPSGAQRRSGRQWWCARGRDDPGEQAARRLQEEARNGLEGGRRDDEARGYGAGDGRCVQGTDRAVRRRAMPGRRAVAGPFTVGARHRADLPCDHRVDRGRRQASREGRQHMQCHRQQADPDRRKADAQRVVHGREITTASPGCRSPDRRGGGVVFKGEASDPSRAHRSGCRCRAPAPGTRRSAGRPVVDSRRPPG